VVRSSIAWCAADETGAQAVRQSGSAAETVATTRTVRADRRDGTVVTVAWLLSRSFDTR
jgi:hypothetical protein